MQSRDYNAIPVQYYHRRTFGQGVSFLRLSQARSNLKQGISSHVFDPFGTQGQSRSDIRRIGWESSFVGPLHNVLTRGQHSLSRDLREHLHPNRKWLKVGLYQPYLQTIYVSSFQVNKVRLYRELFRSRYEHIWTDFGYDRWTSGVKLPDYQRQTFHRYLYFCSATDSPWEIVLGYMHYLSLNVSNHVIGTTSRLFRSYHRSNVPLQLLNQDLKHFESLGLAFSNVNYLHFYTDRKRLSIDPFASERTNHLVGTRRIFLTTKQEDLLVFLNNYDSVMENLFTNYSESRRPRRYVGSWGHLIRHNKILTLGWLLFQPLSLLAGIEVLPGVKLSSASQRKGYLHTLTLKDPIGLTLSLNGLKINGMIKALHSHAKYFFDPKTIEDKSNLASELWQKTKRSLFDLKNFWSGQHYMHLNPLYIFLTYYLHYINNMLVIELFRWFHAGWNLAWAVKNLDIYNVRLEGGFGFNRTIPIRSMKSTNRQDELYLNEVWSNTLLSYLGVPKVHRIEEKEEKSKDVIRYVCDNHREGLFLQSSNLNLFLDVKLDVHGDVRLGYGAVTTRPVGFGATTPRRGVTKSYLSMRPEGLSWRQVVWTPFDLTRSYSKRKLFEDWYSTRTYGIQFTTFKIPNVFLRDQDSRKSTLPDKSFLRLDKKQIEDYVSLYSLDEETIRFISEEFHKTRAKDKRLIDDSKNDLPSMKSLYHLIETNLTRSEPLNSVYKFFIYQVQEIKGHKRTSLLSARQLLPYWWSTVVFPFMEFDHGEESNSPSFICSYEYRTAKTLRCGENHYHRKGTFKPQSSLLRFYWAVWQERRDQLHPTPKDYMWLERYGIVKKDLLPFDLQFLNGNLNYVTIAHEAENLWTVKPVEWPFDLELSHDYVASNVYDDVVLKYRERDLSLRIEDPQEKQVYQVHSYFNSNSKIKIIMLIKSVGSWSFELNGNLKFKFFDFGVNHAGRLKGDRSLTLMSLPFPFYPYTFSGNYFRIFEGHPVGKILIKTYDAFLLVRHLTYAQLLEVPKSTLFQYYDVAQITTWPYLLTGSYNALNRNFGVWLFDIPRAFHELVRETPLITEELVQTISYFKDIERVQDISVHKVTLLLAKLFMSNRKAFWTAIKYFVRHYPRYYLTKFFLPFLRPDFYVEYLSLLFGLEMNVSWKITYDNLSLVHLLIILLSLNEDSITKDGKIKIFRFNLDRLVWHGLWNRQGVKVSFTDRSNGEQLDYHQVKKSWSWDMNLLSVKPKKENVASALEKLRSEYRSRWLLCLVRYNRWRQNLAYFAG